MLVASFNSIAQDDMTIYSLRTLPQRHYDNPAFMPEYKYHFGIMPLTSSNYSSISNSGFKADDLIRPNNTNDSLYLDVENTIDKLAKKNYLMLNQHVEWLSFGFKIKQTQYINFAISDRIKSRYTYPSDFVSLVALGNAQFIGSIANLDGIGIDLIHYREFALGYTNQIDSKLTMGARGKLLFGLSNMWTKSSNLSLAVNEDYYDLTANSNIEVYTSAPEKVYEIIDDTTNSVKILNSDIEDYLLNFGNPGFGIDIGFDYRITDSWSISGSILDLGYIFWRTGTRKYSSVNKSFTYRGIDITELVKNDSLNVEDYMNNLVDSISEIFKIEETNVNYSSPLNPKIYLSSCYNITEKDRAIAVFRADFYENSIHPAFTFAYNRTFDKVLDFSISYSYMNRDFLNLGIGSSVKFGAFQIYLISDNLLAAIVPYHTKNINVHFGCNFVFNYKNSDSQAENSSK